VDHPRGRAEGLAIYGHRFFLAQRSNWPMSIDEQEFAVALAKGSGRTMILLTQTAEPEKFKDELISACVINLA